MKKSPVHNPHSLPDSFRPLLWSLKWEEVDSNKDKEDIILGAVNEGTLDHWRWIIRAYGREAIREVLAKRLATEFHPESLNLARIVFDLPSLSYAR